MLRAAILVGTSHSLQRGSLELKEFLEIVCRDFKVNAVAEEVSQEALVEKECAVSIPMQVASAIDICHRLCDPDNAQRVKLGIWQQADIRVRALPKTLSESEVEAQLAECNARRERYWLDQLQDLNVWPVLFVCGADHVASFSELLRQAGIGVHIAAKDWASNNTVERDAPQAARPSTLR